METKKLKRLPRNKPYFEANGHKYVVSDGLSVERYMKHESLTHDVGFGRTFNDLYRDQVKAYTALNEGRVADAAVIIHNIIRGMKEKIDGRSHPMLMMCALFINREDEDTTIVDEKLMAEKIEDWSREGYAIDDFFSLAWSLVQGASDAYNENLAVTSQKKKTQSQSTTKGKN